MKNILWLASWYPNKLDNFDGDFIQRHAKAVSLFCKVTVIYVKKDPGTRKNTTAWKQCAAGNLTEHIVYYNPVKTGIKLLDRILSQFKYFKCYHKAIKKYINETGKPAYVHVHVAMNAGIVALWIKKKWGVDFFVTEHWTAYHKQANPSIYSYHPVFKKINKKILEKAALFLPVSKNLGEVVNKNFVKIPYHVIPNVVNTELFYLKMKIAPRFRFIHVSHMNYQKNPEGLFKACGLLKCKGYDFELVILGNNEESLKLIAKEHDLTDEVVTFIDSVPYEQVARQMQDSSAFIIFSRFENLPCVILEALCCGLPVISSDVGGISEVININNGILVESENVVQLAEAMQSLITNYQQYDRSEIATSAAEKYNYEKVGRQFYDLYNKMFANPV